MIAQDPNLATALGVPADPAALTDYSPAGFAQRAERRLAYRDKVARLAATNESERIAQATFLERVETAIAADEALLPQSELSVIASGLHGVREVFDLMPTGTVQDWEILLERLGRFPTAIEQLIQTWEWAAHRGVVSSSAQISQVAQQARGWSRHGVFDALVEQAPPQAPTDHLRKAASTAHQALLHVAEYLDSELAPRGGADQAVGQERYSLASRQFLGAQIDFLETYAWAFDELSEIAREMRLVAVQLVGEPNVAAAVAALDADPNRQIHGKAAFADWMQGLADTAIRELNGTHFDIPEQIRRIECRIAPTMDGGIYYTGPSEDFSRPGRMWWSVPHSTETFATWRETTTVFHEGVPGHHLQIGQAACEREHLNRWQRLMAWVSGHGEGWALYAERLMLELGYLDDPGDHLGMLEAQAFRAARVIVDIGMHLKLTIPADNPFGFAPGQVWTPELGREFMRAWTSMGEAELDFEINRYLGWPGQAPSYKVGERLWLQARAEAKERLGAAFNLRDFHSAALRMGGMGLEPLAQALRRI